MQVSNESAKNIPADPCIDASRSSSLYQDNLTEIKVNALFGLNLIKAFYRIIAGTGVGLATNNNGEYNYSHWSGVFTPVGDAWGGYERATDQTNKDFGTQFNMYASRSNAIYGAADTVHPNSLRSYCLIRYM